MSTDHGTRSGPQRLRASDAEREQIATIVRAAMAEGRLNLEEGEQRLGAVYAAKFRDELAPLTVDLPDGGRRALAQTPEFQASLRRGMRRRAGFALVVVLVLIGLAALPGAHFWPVVPLIFLLVVLHRRAHFRHHAHAHGHRDWPAPWNRPDWR
jgi:hypothetical protein